MRTALSSPVRRATDLPAPAVQAARTAIRALAAADVPAVARLFKSTFRAGDAVPTEIVAAYLQRLFLDGPDHDPASPSLVHATAAGDVTGFIGSLAQPMVVNGRSIRAAHACSLMVADPAHDHLAGARLLRSFVGGPQDLSFSETSSPLSRKLWSRLGGRSVAAYSMKWVRLLRPAAAAVALAATHWRRAALLSPLASGLDRLVSRRVDGVFWALPPAPAGVVTTPVDRAALAPAIAALVRRFALAPAWTAAQLDSRLAHAAHLPAYGELVGAVVSDRAGPAGAFVYHVRRNGLAHVLQVLARDGGADAVVASLIRDADAHGAAALVGRSDPAIMEALLYANSVILHRGATTVHSRDPEVLDAIARGDAMLTGLAGESWSELIGGLTAVPHRGP
ncbi:hypothetical protein PQJ75_15285 [Rhodoplanes sp. TEM]|uniref:GNAT family N-acetyltransferase n=1 Tax=Rhodoplanes tepidamans TaxID=200616 RepID=A0ABT5JAE7_RHOTP|nr:MULTISPECIES: hypothetical protein [Rhodoplanes]MDC7786457.1 hypothetical protein [Rhodoplanes tepidamans]MDC7985099.1 hypothetical protein [Rhodoplanes sp. TEM]MDQ0357342.1 hypothetical protein [Rhodoplanes tepidamans]